MITMAARADAGFFIMAIFWLWKSPVLESELLKEMTLKRHYSVCGNTVNKHIGASLRRYNFHLLGKVVNHRNQAKFRSYFWTLRTEYTVMI